MRKGRSASCVASLFLVMFLVACGSSGIGRVFYEMKILQSRDRAEQSVTRGKEYLTQVQKENTELDSVLMALREVERRAWSEGLECRKKAEKHGVVPHR